MRKVESPDKIELELGDNVICDDVAERFSEWFWMQTRDE